MTDILPPAGWPNVRQLETNEFATGGANGNMNEQAKSLAARSELLKQYAALPYESKTGGYALNERVQLATGDIVRSTIPSNVNNPNVDMAGWKPTEDSNVITTVESIADLLAIQYPKDGQTVQAKGFYEATNFALAQPHKGGGDFIYVASKSTVNDGFMCFNGWTRQIADREYNAYMSGCKCDGVTDDTQNFDKIMYWLEQNNVGGTVTVEGDLFINGELPRTGKMQYVTVTEWAGTRIGVRLVSNVTIAIAEDAKISFGGYFNNCNTFLFCGAYRTNVNDWECTGDIRDGRITGGTIDLSKTGTMETQQWTKRYVIFSGSMLRFECDHTTFRGGDFANLVVGLRLGVDQKVHDCYFIDNMKDNTASHDHTAVYLCGDGSEVFNNIGKQSSVWARHNACVFEPHGNNQKYYNNKTWGYNKAVIVGAYNSGYESPNTDTPKLFPRTNVEIYNNYSKSSRFIEFWGDGVLPLGLINTYQNTHDADAYITNAEALASGIGESIPIQISAFVSTLFGTPTAEVQKGIIFKENIMNATFDPRFYVEHVYHAGNLLTNVSFLDNYWNVPTLISLGDTYTFSLNGFTWIRNSFNESALAPNKTPFEVSPDFMNGCLIDLSFTSDYTNTVEAFKLTLKGSPGDSNGNTIVVEASDPRVSPAWVSGFGPFTENWFDTNSLIYPAKFTSKVYQDSTKLHYLIMSEDPKIFAGVKRIDIYKYIQSRDNTLIMPPVLLRSSKNATRACVGVATSIDESESLVSDLTFITFGVVTC